MTREAAIQTLVTLADLLEYDAIKDQLKVSEIIRQCIEVLK